MNRGLFQRIKYWKDKYRDMPNGYFVSLLIGDRYISEVSRISPSRRRKDKEKRRSNEKS